MLAHQCLNHPAREAAARCPECGRFFCRECVTEHAGRMTCAACLARLTRPAVGRQFHLNWITDPILIVFGTLTAWAVFRVLGGLLLSLPSEWHEGSIWRQFPMH